MGSHWLYRSVYVVNLISLRSFGSPFATAASINLFTSAFAPFS